MPPALANTVRSALETYAAADPWRRTWLTSAAGRTAWANGIIASIDAYKLRVSEPYIRARWQETRAGILVPSQTPATLTSLDTFVLG